MIIIAQVQRMPRIWCALMAECRDPICSHEENFGFSWSIEYSQRPLEQNYQDPDLLLGPGPGAEGLDSKRAN